MSFYGISIKVWANWLQLALIVIVSSHAVERCLAQGFGNHSISPPLNTMFPGYPLDEDILKGTREIVFRRNVLEEDSDLMNRVDEAKPINIAQLKSAENLESLVINMVDLKPLEIQQLAKLRNLKRIEYQDMTQSDEKIRAVATLPFLEELDLFGSDTSNASAKHLARMENLKRLDLRHTKIDSDLFARHGLVKGVTHLSVSSEDLDDRFLTDSKLSRSLTHLYVARLGEPQLSPTPDLKHLRHLKVLYIHGIFTHSQLREIRQQLPETEINPKTSGW